MYGSFYDSVRNRTIPYKVYYPDTLSGECPVVIFSHGLGGSVEAAVYLGEHLAQNGFICFHIQHPGSDESVWKDAKTKKEIIGKLKESIKDINNAINRFKDIPFVIDEIIKLNASSEIFKNHLDTANIALAGHSYGARTVLISSGERVAKGKISFKEPRIKAGVALSPSLPDNPPDDLSTIYKDINIPVFHITGTEDGDPLGRKKNFTPDERTKPYKNINTSTQYLLVLNKATHMTFNGNEKLNNGDPYFAEHLESVKKGVTAFLNYYLKKSETDGSWLKNEYRNALNTDDKFEWKN
jgi:predicted dienelactone hydrolase